MNLFILFLVIAGLALFRSGRDIGAGLVLALAIACKVTPALSCRTSFGSGRGTTCRCRGGPERISFCHSRPRIGLGGKSGMLTSWTRNMVSCRSSPAAWSPANTRINRCRDSSSGSLPPAHLLGFEGDRYVPKAFHNLAGPGPGAEMAGQGGMALFLAGRIALVPDADSRAPKNSRLAMELRTRHPGYAALQRTHLEAPRGHTAAAVRDAVLSTPAMKSRA